MFTSNEFKTNEMDVEKLTPKERNLALNTGIIGYAVLLPVVGAVLNFILTKFTDYGNNLPVAGFILAWIHYDFTRAHLEQFKGDKKNIYLPVIIVPILSTALFALQTKILKPDMLNDMQKFGSTMAISLIISVIVYFIATQFAIKNYKHYSSKYSEY